MSGWVLFAAAFLFIVGVFNVLYGFIIVFNDDWPVLTPSAAIAVDVGIWGWVIVAFGFLQIGAGSAVLSGKLWGRFVGLLVGGTGLVAALLYFPIYPWYAGFAIAMNTAVLWGLTVHGHEVGFKP